LNNHPHIFFKAVIILFSCLLCSCSYQYLDATGNHNVIGLVNISTNTNLLNQTCQINNVEVTTIGLGAVSLPSHGSLALGYSKNATTIVTNNTSSNKKSKGKDNE